MPENVTATAPEKWCIVFWDGQRWRWIPYNWTFGVSDPSPFGDSLDDAIRFAHFHGYKIMNVRNTTPANVKKTW